MNDPEVTAVVETIGGTKVAYPYVKAVLESGRHVATSNKELVATHGAELLALARQKGVCFLFEASVGGGTPVITPCLLYTSQRGALGVLLVHFVALFVVGGKGGHFKITGLVQRANIHFGCRQFRNGHAGKLATHNFALGGVVIHEHEACLLYTSRCV